MLSSRRKRGFTLVELLVVVAILGLLVSLLMPTLSAAKEAARNSYCKANLHSLALGLAVYESASNGLVVPSYNMSGINGGPDVPLDGWGPILDRDRVIGGSRKNDGSLFVCPNMVDVEGMASGQTGADPQRPKGWMDWPNTRNGTSNLPVTIPDRGFNRIIRLGYWINADNPIGGATAVTNEVYYTSSVGYGPGTNGVYMQYTRSSAFKHPSRLIALADGMYAGRQRDVRLGVTNLRIGYRHPGRVGTCNIAAGDGHADSIEGDQFPRGTGGSATAADLWADNTGGPYTVFANPYKTLTPP